jgi:hypothetical protein
MMPSDPSNVERAVSRTLRDSLERMQRSAKELDQAVADFVAACSSNRPANALPPLLRAQTASAALTATLDVLSRFVASTLQPANPYAAEPVEVAAPVTEQADAPAIAEPAVIAEPPAIAEPSAIVEPPASAEPPVVETAEVAAPEPEIAHDFAAESAPEVLNVAPPRPEPVAAPDLPAVPVWAPPLQPDRELEAALAMEHAAQAASMAIEPQPMAADSAAGEFSSHAAVIDDPEPIVEDAQATVMEESDIPVSEREEPAAIVFAEMAETEAAPAKAASIGDASDAPTFDIAALPTDERELHRRASRVAKVSMQDIKLLQPELVEIGREHKDLCFRLRNEIERAHKEYGRRFQPILSHPVDYFYDWMVEILAAGDPSALGEYPYPTQALRR